MNEFCWFYEVTIYFKIAEIAVSDLLVDRILDEYFLQAYHEMRYSSLI